MTWEERMAEKARVRKAISDAIESQESQRDWDITQDQWEEDMREKMTVEDAKELLSYPSHACACMGGPNCCIIRYKIARELV